MKRMISHMPLWIRICSITFILISLAALFANILMPYDPNANSLLERNLPPVFMGGSMSHIFGTDELGRDIFSRILYGTRVSLGMTMFGIVIGGSVGVLLGLSAGYIGGIWDRIVMALINFQQSVPVTLIIMLGVVVFGRSIPVLMCFIGLAKWEYYAKFTRSTVLGIKDKQFVEAAKSYHASGFRIVFRYIFPNVLPSLIVAIALSFPSVLMLESSLTFIGIGVQPPTATLGQMVGNGRNYLVVTPWLALVPAAVIVILSYCVQQIGEWMRDEMDIRLLKD
ncbi:dipeptide transport system permease protein DppC [Clostridium sp. CAG:81]|nr:dipeptide transport system permease protein DppC [Clostridium sp. CAG:81]